MSYFEIPAERKLQAPPPRQWTRPPLQEVGVELPLEQIVAGTAGVRVHLRRLVVYSTGFAADLLIDWREDAVSRAVRGTLFNPRDDAFVRVAIEFPNGRSATNLDRWSSTGDDESGSEAEARSLPTPPLIGFGFAHADANNLLRSNTWIWGIPEPGAVTLVLEWPIGHVEVTRVPLDGSAIRAAADRSTRLWPEGESAQR